MLCLNLHGPPPNYDPVLKEYNEFLRNRASKKTSPHESFVAPLDRPSHNAHIAQLEYNEFLQYRASKQTSPQVASVVQHDVVVTSNFLACVSKSNTQNHFCQILFIHNLFQLLLWPMGYKQNQKGLEKPYLYLLSL